MPNQPPTYVPIHIVPSPIEQQHIHTALDAAQTAISAINTIAVVAGLAIAVLTLGMAVLAFLGFNAIKRVAKTRAEHIANDHLATYIASMAFQDAMRVKIEKAVEARWQSTIVVKLTDDPKPAGESPEFPTGTAK